MNIEVFKGEWDRNIVSRNKDKIYVFGDNNARVGKGGQAVIRGLDNTHGIRTKKGPNNRPVSFYSDNSYESNISKIDQDILSLKEKALRGKTIVFSDGGYGTGLSQLYKYAPKTLDYLNQSLLLHFDFDNTSGKKVKTISGHDHIVNGKHVSLIKREGLVQGVNNILFRKELLNKGYYTIEKLIETGNKTSFTSVKRYDSGQVLKLSTFGSDNYIIAKVINSYKLKDVDENMWSFFEGFEKELLNMYDKKVFFNTHFKFESILTKDGKLIFKDGLFTKEETLDENMSNDLKKKKDKNMSNDVNSEKTSVNWTLGLLDDDSGLKKKLLKKNITGDIKKLNILNEDEKTLIYEVTNSELIHYVKVVNYPFFKRIKVLFTRKR
jgi:hypothetical protein